MPRTKKTPSESNPSAEFVSPLAQLTRPLFATPGARGPIESGWRPLFGDYRAFGFRFGWHELRADAPIDWARAFQPSSVGLCLNLDGRGVVSNGRRSIELPPQSYAFYFQGEPPLAATRVAGERHCFIAVEFSPEFLQDHLRAQRADVHPLIRPVVDGKTVESWVASPEPLFATLLQFLESLRHCPVFMPAQELWFRSKAQELAAHVFFSPPHGELLCTRAQRLARERVEKAKLILKDQMENPPSLEQLARMVGCSPFYLSRQFAREGGMTMQQFLRHIRMTRAAELLRSGKCNVTEAAMEVGYNSLSHFSSAFHETFGCCPGLYPVRTISQKRADEPESDEDS